LLKDTARTLRYELAGETGKESVQWNYTPHTDLDTTIAASSLTVHNNLHTFYETRARHKSTTH